MGYRIEKDSLGEIEVDDSKCWGAQTERSRRNFQIGSERMPLDVIYGLVEIKRAAAIVNRENGQLDDKRSALIVSACDSILSGKWDDQFPLKVYQTGSGTQTNMNVNEVIAFLCRQEGGDVHANDHVNMSQSSNDTFPTAMHIAAYGQIVDQLLPEIDEWLSVLTQLEEQYQTVIKIGRTHLQDATPLTFGQEISGWRVMLEKAEQFIRESSDHLRSLAIGGTAVGTGLNAPDLFDEDMCAQISRQTGWHFVPEANKFYGLTSHSALSFAHGALRSLAADLMKIANDIRWLASGPRAGFGEVTIPANEPGSSIMPGKVNPTQAEALTMVATRIMGNDVTIQVASSQGNFELNVYKPVIIDSFLQSVTLLSQAMASFRVHCLAGLTANRSVMAEGVQRSLMLVTALSPHIGYEKSADVAKLAHKDGLTLKEAVIRLGYATGEQYDEWVVPEEMI
ncbi:class II fumarate hydratase [Vagococcus acidifermentans]|uniref:Fumarate hydratase class II n=1 Tax=Vagococcus acidifermentans TaxID=564710 RepID=A0A430AXS4_9ENTE|nr:class II fumarate hydratase [Vagococcus acidifermentans]RSU12845.1 fumarate hydratase, class II [Vagococcus acidifermentans]